MARYFNNSRRIFNIGIMNVFKTKETKIVSSKDTYYFRISLDFGSKPFYFGVIPLLKENAHSNTVFLGLTYQNVTMQLSYI